jgi:flavin reductase (DIM6/NTAB) family NADH-FMN oxidoreductase RutF
LSFSPREFRDALGLFPTGVSVVTACAPDGRQVGITVNSFTSVSLDPPLVSFNLARSLASLPDLLRAETFVVNLLTEGQSTVSQGFARALSDKWSGARARAGVTGNPVLEPRLAAFECARYATHEAGDHVIVVGRVLHFDIDDREAPLVFFRGRYRSIGAPVGEQGQDRSAC